MKFSHTLLAVVVGLAAPLAAFPNHADAQAKKVGANKNTSANAVATGVQGFYNKTKDSKGTVTFQKPGKMSWRYTNNGNRVVSDGKLIKIYESDNKQMYEQAMGKSQYPAALAFLVGGGNLTKEFKLRKLDSRQLKFEGGYVLEGVPKKPTPAYTKILLYVDGGTYQVRRVLLLDAQGNRNRFDFISPTVNEKVKKDEFTFKPPPGTQVVKP
jgi:outer membrane lipoprotein carrier protein